MKIKANLRRFDASINDYFDSRAIYCLSSFYKQQRGKLSANSPELKFSIGNAGNKSVILPFQIQECSQFKGG